MAESRRDYGQLLFTGAILLLGFGSIIWSAVAGALGLGAPSLEIVAAVEPAVPVAGEAGSIDGGVVHADSTATGAVESDSIGTGAWNVTGRVLEEGRYASDANIWAIASTPRGNRYTPEAARTDQTGSFGLGPMPQTLAGDSVSEITVFARVERDSTVVEGNEILRLSAGGGTRWIPLPLGATLTIGLIFAFSIVIALIQSASVAFQKVKYFTIILLAFLLTFAMLAYVTVGIRQVNQTAEVGEVLSLGYANIHYGTFVTGMEPEWIFSLTTPPRVDSGEAINGFGVPLWVLFFSVLGAAVYTVNLVVKEIANPVNFGDSTVVRNRVEHMVRHQFYIVFAPVGAIIVYQFLVVTGAASREVTVAMAALASGVALNLLLDRAFEFVQGLISESVLESGQS